MTARWVHRPRRHGVGAGPSTPASSLQEWCPERARSVQEVCKQPARIVHGVCKECARSLQERCVELQGVCKRCTRSMQGAKSLDRACKECATSVHLAPLGHRQKAKGAIAPCAPAGQRDGVEGGTDRTDRPHFSVPKSKPAEGCTHCISKEQ